jgi:peptidoglycan hydrolase-like protein with peptidoglycan-binding domain
MGAKGGLVQRLQDLLKKLGFDPGEYIGEFGAKTAEAVVALQRKLGVDPTGVYDRGTERAIVAELKSSSPILKTALTLGDVTAATAIIPTTPTATPSTPLTSEPTGMQAIFKSPIFWLAASAGLIYIATRGGGNVVIEGVEELGHGDEEESDGEEEEATVEPPPRKSHYRKPKKKSKKKTPAGESTVEAAIA